MNKPKNAAELTKFLSASLPLYSVTGHAKDLRKIEADPIGKGKSVIIWYGQPRIQELTRLRVTVNLTVKALDFGEENIAGQTQNELNRIWSVLENPSIESPSSEAEAEVESEAESEAVIEQVVETPIHSEVEVVEEENLVTA